MAARKHHNEVTAGLFVVVSVGALLGIVIWLGASDILRGGGRQVVFFAPETVGAVGLQEGSKIHYGDAAVGEITAIEPVFGEGCYYRGRLDVAGLDVFDDAEAEIAQPFIGLATLVIKDPGGGEGSAAPDRGHAIPIRLGGMGAILSTAGAEFDPNVPGSLLHKLRELVDTVHAVATSMEAELDRDRPDALLTQVRSAVGGLEHQLDAEAEGSLMAKVHGLTDDVGHVTASLRYETDREQSDSLIASVNRSAGSIEEMLADARPKVAEILSRIEEVAATLDAAGGDVAETAGAVRQLVVLNREQIDEMIDNLVLVSANLRATSQEVRRNPWRLLRSPDRDEVEAAELYAAARDYAEGARELDQAIMRLAALRRIPADDPSLQQTVDAAREHLQESLEHFRKVEQGLWEEVADE